MTIDRRHASVWLGLAVCGGSIGTGQAAAQAAPTAASAASASAGGNASDPLVRPALATPRAAGAVLLGVARAGARLVAVGERGVVLLSDDGGTTWRQAPTPLSTTLTAVRFVDAQRGWAVGHAGAVLHTQDAGEHWVRQLDGQTAADLALKAAQALPDSPQAQAQQRNAQRLVADGADKPWLDLHFFDARQGLVVGAYGLICRTDDGGKTWASWIDHVDNPKGLHLNAIAAQGSTVYLAGEQGLLLRSDDGGQHFTRLATPYAGSWFAAAVLPSGRLVVAGLRGNVYTSDNQGQQLDKAALPVPVTVSGLYLLADGGLAAVNQAGQVLLSKDQGRTLLPVPMPPGPPWTALVQRADGQLVGSSVRGARPLPPLNAPAAPPPAGAKPS